MEISAPLALFPYCRNMQSKVQRENAQFMNEALHICYILVALIENKEEPYEDLTIQTIIEGDESYRGYHPVCLFAAIQFIDELAQIIRPKRIAEMDENEAWIWEMRRVFDCIGGFIRGRAEDAKPLPEQMSLRLASIIVEERRKYES